MSQESFTLRPEPIHQNLEALFSKAVVVDPDFWHKDQYVAGGELYMVPLENGYQVYRIATPEEYSQLRKKFGMNSIKRYNPLVQ